MPLTNEKTELVVADVLKDAGGRENEQELALQIIPIVADRLGVKYEMTKK